MSFVCASIYASGCTQVHNVKNNFSTIIPQKGWKSLKTDKAEAALWNEQFNATIAFISTDMDADEKYPTKTLSKQLFIGIKKKETVLNELMAVNDQTALHTILTGEIDSHKLKIDSYIIKTENVVYDLICWAPVDLFDYVKDDFEKMVRSLKFTISQ